MCDVAQTYCVAQMYHLVIPFGANMHIQLGHLFCNENGLFCSSSSTCWAGLTQWHILFCPNVVKTEFFVFVLGFLFSGRIEHCGNFWQICLWLTKNSVTLHENYSNLSCLTFNMSLWRLSRVNQGEVKKNLMAHCCCCSFHTAI